MPRAIFFAIKKLAEQIPKITHKNVGAPHQ